MSLLVIYGRLAKGIWAQLAGYVKNWNLELGVVVGRVGVEPTAR